MVEVDIVILSKASNDDLKAMTQHSINSAISNTGCDAKVNVWVLEQVPDVNYKNAVTIRNTEPFNYNRSCNIGAKAGKGEWIVFSNNDLDFEPYWLKYLLDSGHPVVSPKDPLRSSQSRVYNPVSGYINGLHFSGWCFMMKRDLWEKIGMLDEDFVFWCADDSVIEQLRQVGVKPRIIPLARVRHLVSRTMGKHGNPMDDGWMTWAMVQKFEKKYGPHRMRSDQRYRTWLRRHVI